MIWDIIEESTFDNHFKNENLTLEQLLVDENILTQMKNLNPSLLQYIETNIDDIMQKLIKYATTMPSQKQGNDRCYRLPYVSSELLAIDNELFYTALLGKIEHNQSNANQKSWIVNLQALFAMLNDPQSVNNELLLGYFAKVSNNLHKGRKIQYSRSIMQNSDIFLNNIDKSSIGAILSQCIILIDMEEGVLLEQRVQLLRQLIGIMEKIDQSISQGKKLDIRQINRYQVSANILIEVLGKFKTFSSGEEIINSIFDCKDTTSTGQNSHILKLLSHHSEKKADHEIFLLAKYRMMSGLLTRSKQKIYNPQTDIFQHIFTYPSALRSALCQFVAKQLSHCHQLEVQSISENQTSIKYQDHKALRPINKIVFAYFEMISQLIDNKITEIIQDKENGPKIIKFALEIFENHPKNDVLLVNIDKLLGFTIKTASTQKYICSSNNIYAKITELYSKNRLLYRPHIYKIWQNLKDSNLLQAGNKQQSQDWKCLNKQFQELLAIYSNKTAALQIERPKDVKLVIDEEDIVDKAASDHESQMSKVMHSHVAQESAHEMHGVQDNTKGQQNKLKDINKMATNKKQESKKQAIFDPFSQFGTITKANDKKPIKKEETKESKSGLDFSAFTKF